MKQFEERQLDEARAYAMKGGQALHVHRFTMGGHRLFRRYKEAAHLFDQNRERLIKTVRSLGVRVVKVEKEGTPSQHVDLCAMPLIKAKLLAKEHVEQMEMECT